MRLTATALILLPVCLALTGCKDQSEAESILPTACKSFTDTEIYKFDPKILWVQTHVDGITSSVAETMFKQACVEAVKNFGRFKVSIQTELTFDQKQVLIVGFKHFWVVWPVANGCDLQGVPIGYQMMNAQMLDDWMKSHMKRIPTPEQILVVTLQDVENTPKGEPMHLRTLEEISREKTEKLAEELSQRQQREKMQDATQQSKPEQ